MVSARVAVNPAVVSHYVMQSRVSPEEINVKGLDEILEGQRQPTFNQISKIANKINLPVGLLVLPEVLPTEESSLNFRTIGSEPLQDMSPELRDTIKEMESKQDFLRDEAEADEVLDFIGSYADETDNDFVAEQIREYLGLPCPLVGSTPDEVLSTVRQAVSSIGVYVFINGKVKDNTHRSLSLSEFRGFVLSDPQVPIIFINGRDSKRGQLFTLIHELVHLFVGSGAGSQGEIMETVDYSDPQEARVNAITAQILMPLSAVRGRKLSDVASLAQEYKVSETVALRRLFDAGEITRGEYVKHADKLEQQYRKGSSGGNYHNTLTYRIDHKFFLTVQQALNSNKITHTEAFDIVGVGYKGYRVLAERVQL